MASIKAPILDIIAKIETVTDFQFVRIFNNQFDQIEDDNGRGSQTYSFPFPCAFVEVVSPADYSQLALGITASDITFRIHIGQVEYDSMDGKMEQNVSIFDLKDKLVKALTYYEPTACGGLMKIAESQDFQHTNVYHYVVDFICHFIDDTADMRQYDIESEPPTELDLTVEIVTEI